MIAETIHQLEIMLKPESIFVGLQIAGISIPLDLSNRHERSYFIQRAFGIKYPQSDVDRMIFQAVIRQGDTVLDVGGNIGVTACEALECGAKSVMCVEPEPSLASRLRNISDDRIDVREMALGGTAGSCTLYISSTHNQGHTIKPDTVEMFPTLFGQEMKKCKVKLGTIDETFCNQHFDIWKIDAEGAEPEIIKGASRHLAQNPPRAIICELYGNLSEIIIQILHPTHPYAYRAFIRKNDYSLVLAPPYAESSEDFFTTSPMFIFSITPL